MVVLVQLEHGFRAKKLIKLKVAVSKGFGFVAFDMERLVYPFFVEHVKIYAKVIVFAHFDKNLLLSDYNTYTPCGSNLKVLPKKHHFMHLFMVIE